MQRSAASNIAGTRWCGRSTAWVQVFVNDLIEVGRRRVSHMAQSVPRSCLLGLGLIAVLTMGTAAADTFSRAYYSAKKDQLVVTMSYRGTNPDHVFTVQWGECKAPANGGREMDAEILDSQPQDVEQRDFEKTLRIDLADVACRPARLTLRTAPHFIFTLPIPAKSPRSS